ncbi:STAS domain-containing protein [Listeria costaricensis]|uniref:STAS domain-containing protein n=1 Tax=Listeria costaricensis TaxID=2026604 RepID=UPI000C089297|nr:STAS domain-containing protein [Listeria costaricensis]
MDKNQQLYDYLAQQAADFTNEWYEGIDKEVSDGIYASNDPDVIAKLKRLHNSFYLQFIHTFVSEKGAFFENLDDWMTGISNDEDHLHTPVYQIISEFLRVQHQFIDAVHDFYEKNQDVCTLDDVRIWSTLVVNRMGDIIVWFTKENMLRSEERLNAQQETIMELSSPVIKLTESSALLPLIGEIDTVRARFLLENTLLQCAEKNVSRLFIDLSGVMIIDTMVAQQLFQLVDTLRLIGVKTILSGLRPEIAQTAVQLGIDFENVEVRSTLLNVIKEDL